jgi:hypothetical protein
MSDVASPLQTSLLPNGRFKEKTLKLRGLAQVLQQNTDDRRSDC